MNVWYKYTMDCYAMVRKDKTMQLLLYVSLINDIKLVESVRAKEWIQNDDSVFGVQRYTVEWQQKNKDNRKLVHRVDFAGKDRGKDGWTGCRKEPLGPW